MFIIKIRLNFLWGASFRLYIVAKYFMSAITALLVTGRQRVRPMPSYPISSYNWFGAHNAIRIVPVSRIISPCGYLGHNFFDTIHKSCLSLVEQFARNLWSIAAGFYRSSELQMTTGLNLTVFISVATTPSQSNIQIQRRHVSRRC